MKRMSLRTRRWLLAATLALISPLLFTLGVRSHIVTEEPWHPVPAAYLRSLFYANLKPINWQLIVNEYEQAIADAGYGGKSVYDFLRNAKEVARVDHVDAIRKAIANNDRLALYATSTRAVSQLVRSYIIQAEAKLSQPGAAVGDVLNAQRIYRAFGQNFISQSDPEAFHRLGRAWLDMSSSVGSAGVMGIGGTAPHPAKFTAARKVIEGYLTANYEVEKFTQRGRLEPISETLLAGGKTVHVDPWLPPRSNVNPPNPLPRLILNFEARGFDEKDLFLVAYGDMLFDSPEIFGEPARSLGITCSTCHPRSDVNRKFLIPGISQHAGSVDVDGHFFNPRFNDQRTDPLDIPSLRGIRFTAPYGRDGRFASLRDFVRNVIVNEFKGDEPTPLMLDAMVTYMLEFDWLPSPYLNPDGTLKDNAPKAAKRGAMLFNTPYKGLGGRSCATCHIPSANFTDGLRHDIGSGDPASPNARDSFFDTPTLINVTHTAPYFHDGSLDSLADVVAWFDQRFTLGLTVHQRKDLTAYLEAVGAGEEPFEVFDDENTLFRLAWGELTVFISTLDTLIPARDGYHADLAIRTVARDLRLDASALKDRSQAPLVYEVADHLENIRVAIQANDWKRAEILWEEYKRLEAKYDPVLK
ncbi:MAG: cytochrome c peroxidase [Candidatus Methylomirabilales bacterium]